jgi:hypothetical protein
MDYSSQPADRVDVPVPRSRFATAWTSRSHELVAWFGYGPMSPVVAAFG